MRVSLTGTGLRRRTDSSQSRVRRNPGVSSRTGSALRGVNPLDPIEGVVECGILVTDQLGDTGHFEPRLVCPVVLTERTSHSSSRATTISLAAMSDLSPPVGCRLRYPGGVSHGLMCV